MPIDTQHPEHIRFGARWTKSAHALGDEDTIKGENETYLPKPGGMKKNDKDGSEYKAYKSRARFPEVTTQALTGIVGLIFEKDPVGSTDEQITNSGLTNLQLARDVIRAVASKGRDILVVDAPQASSGGGTPFITRYAAESLINWKVSPTNPNELTLAVFEEQEVAPDDLYGHETTKTYRRYLRLDTGAIEVTRWTAGVEGGAAEAQIGEPVILPVREMPIVIAGSIDTSPACDPVPVMPVVYCALAYYQKSASYEQALYLTSQPTPWVQVSDQDQYDAILAQGIGSSTLWALPLEGSAGFLEISSEGITELQQAMREELRQAESHAVRLTQSSDGVESAASIAMRAATQHASIYSIADTVSIAISRAQEMRANWGALTKPETFALRTDFTEAYAGEKMISALNAAINAGNAPRSPLFEAIRRSGLSELTDEQMADEIETTGGLALALPTGGTSVVVTPEPEDALAA